MSSLNQQSTEEWLTAYGGGEPPPALPEPEPARTFRFAHHRTTKTGRLILSFADENGVEALIWFNVETKGRTRNYRTGDNGQFNSRPRSKFRKFWRSITGKEPARWSRVHHQLRAELSQYEFKGTTQSHKMDDGRAYLNLIVQEKKRLNAVHENCTKTAQELHSECTRTAQNHRTAKTLKPLPEKPLRRIQVPSTKSALKPLHPSMRMPEYLSFYSSIPLETMFEAYEERAAIMEFDGGLERHEAELLSAQQHLKINHV